VQVSALKLVLFDAFSLKYNRQGEVPSPHQFAVGVGSFDAYENRFLTLSIQDIAEMTAAEKLLLGQFERNISDAHLYNLTKSDVFIAASDEVKSLLVRRNSAYGDYFNLPPPVLPYRLSGGAASQVPEFPPSDEMSRVHTVVSGAKVNNLLTPNFLDTLGPIAEDEAAFIPPDPLEDKIFLDSSTYDVNSTRKVVTMIAYEFSDRPYFYGTVGGVSVANIAGGLKITVIGDHFQPSGFAVARFTEVESWFPYYSPLYYLNKTHAYFYTPRIPTAVAAHLQLSNNGYIFSQGASSITTSDEGFAFFEVTSRRPVSGSAIGRTGVVLRGAFLRNVVKSNGTCFFGSCNNMVQASSQTEWSDELQTAVCFSPPNSCTELYIATPFRLLVGYEVLFQDIWFYVSEVGPSVLRAQFDPSLRTIIVRLRASTDLGGYSRSESCSKLFTIPSHFFILTSTAAYWPEPFTLVLLLDPSHKLRFNSILEISNGGDIADASDKSLTLAGAIKFIPPDYIAFPTPILTCPLHSPFFNDVFISAHHSFGLLAQNISFAWNVMLSSDFGYSKSLNSNFSLVDENVIRISASNFENITCPLASASCSVELYAQFDIFFNSSSSDASLVLNETFKNETFKKPSIKSSPECLRFRNVQDAVRSNAPACVLWPSVSSYCISNILLPGPSSPKVLHPL
jgi:hypothetical protein